MSYSTFITVGTISAPVDFDLSSLEVSIFLELLIGGEARNSEHIEAAKRLLLLDSKKHPRIVFEMLLQGDDIDDTTYFFCKDGKSYEDHPTNPIFNPSKLV